MHSKPHVFCLFFAVVCALSCGVSLWKFCENKDTILEYLLCWKECLGLKFTEFVNEFVVYFTFYIDNLRTSIFTPENMKTKN